MHIAQAIIYGVGIIAGHTAICVTVLNRIQGVGISHGEERVLKRLLYLFAASMLGYIAYTFIASRGQVLINLHELDPSYFDLCLYWIMFLAVFRPLQVLRDRCRAYWRLEESEVINIPTENHREWAGVTRFPHWPSYKWNQVLSLEVNRKSVLVDDLPDALDGLTITHVSDFHLVGVPAKPFFQWVTEQVNKLESDLICVSGDIVDAAKCVDWFANIFGEMQAPYGKYFVLGNHDIRKLERSSLIATLEALQMQWVGDASHIIDVKGESVRVCGTEMPWADSHPVIDLDLDVAFSIAVMHSPDPISWARRSNVDLALAGHLHGGQIRLPMVGPVVSPSLHGVRMASGVYRRGSTMLHVSRGLSGLQPIRWRCRPEITQLVIRNRS